MKYSNRHLLLDDPNYLEQQPDVNIWESISWGYDKDQWEVLEKIIVDIPEDEKNILWMTFKMQLKQTEIAKHFNCSQPAISQKIQRAISRLKFVLSRNKINEEQFLSDLQEYHYLEGDEAEIIFLYWQTTSQSEVSRKLGKSQSYIYNILNKGMDKLKENDSEYYQTVKQAYDNWGILNF